MRAKNLTNEDSVADQASRAIETGKRREKDIKNTGQRASDASKRFTQNLRKNAAVSKSRDEHRDELKKMTTEDDSIEATLHKELECIKADMDGRMNNTPPRRHKKIRKI
jgi:hypothetical protein